MDFELWWEQEKRIVGGFVGGRQIAELAWNAATKAARSWLPIETAPAGRYIDLWLVSPDDTVDFYCPNAHKVAGKPLRAGRATHYRYDEPKAGWYSNHGLGYPLPIGEMVATHWMPLPEPPLTANTRS